MLLCTAGGNSVPPLRVLRTVGDSRGMLGSRNIAISAISNGSFYSPRYLDPIYYHRFFSCAVEIEK